MKFTYLRTGKPEGKKFIVYFYLIEDFQEVILSVVEDEDNDSLREKIATKRSSEGNPGQ